jgi:DNA repair photolyase
METSSIVKRNKRKITFGTKEWADYNVNCIKGCYNDCRYCYAKIMAKRFGRKTDNNWKNMEISFDSLKRSYKNRSGRIMFPSSHDIIDISPYKEACFQVLEKILESGNIVLITTKPRLPIIEEIIWRYSHFKKQIQFRFTITSLNDQLLRFWEPNAPRFAERFDSLKLAFSEDFKTSVSIEPFLDYDPSRLVELVEPYTTESIWIGKMNYIFRNGLTNAEIEFYNKVRKNYRPAHLFDIYKKLGDSPKIRFKDSVTFQLLKNHYPISTKFR